MVNDTSSRGNCLSDSEADTQGEVSEGKASEAQLSLIRRYVEADGVGEDDLRAELQGRFGRDALEDLTHLQIATLLAEMQRRERFQKQALAAKAPPEKHKL